MGDAKGLSISVRAGAAKMGSVKSMGWNYDEGQEGPEGGWPGGGAPLSFRAKYYTPEITRVECH